MNRIEMANNLFEQPWWLDTVAEGLWDEVVSKDKNGNVIARLAYVKNREKIYMPKLTQTLGVWMADECKEDYGLQKRIYQDLFGQLNDYKDVLISLPPENNYVLPFRWMGFAIEPGFTYRIYDLSDCESIYNKFNKTAKKNIRAAKNKVRISQELHTDVLWEMLDKTFGAQNRKNPMSKELVYRIVEACEKNGSGQYYEAVDENEHVHSCAYFVYDEKVCYYLLGASDSNYRSSGAQSLILWEGIQFAAQHSEIFDFEGSMVEGIENFFRQFGGVCVPHYTVRKQSLYKDIWFDMKPRIKKLIGYKI